MTFSEKKKKNPKQTCKTNDNLNINRFVQGWVEVNRPDLWQFLLKVICLFLNFFSKFFVGHMSILGAINFGLLTTSLLGFQSQSGQPYSNFAQACVTYVPRDFEPQTSCLAGGRANHLATATWLSYVYLSPPPQWTSTKLPEAKSILIYCPMC